MYLQIFAFFCMTIVHSSLCNDDVHNFMNSQQIRMVFQTTANSAPIHEFIAIPHLSPTDIVMKNGERIVKPGTHIRLKAFTNNTHLWLHPSEGMLIQENTPVYYVQQSIGSPQNVSFAQWPGIMKSIGKLYEDLQHWASLVIGVDASGKTRVNGYIGSRRMTVRSLPDDVVNKYLKKRRSVDESEYHLSNFSYHVAFQTPENIEKKHSFHTLNQTNLRHRIDRSIPDDVPYHLYPEILVVVEYSLYRDLGRNVGVLMEYLVAFWNGVDLYYRAFDNPQISLHIVGILVESRSGILPYVSKNWISDRVFNGHNALFRARSFFADIKNDFPYNSYDMAVTLTTQRISGARNSGIVGLSYTGRVCERGESEISSPIIVQDDAVFFGIGTAAHEIGHALGMQHDDGIAVTCESDDGYIMAEYVQYSLNSSSFSNCSIASVEANLRDQNLTCLYNRPAITDYSLPRIMPGKLKSRHEQCVANGYRTSCEDRNADICGMAYCISNENNECEQTIYRVLEGTPCGSLRDMYCLSRRCTQMTQLSPSDHQKMLQAANWIDRG